MKKIKIPFIFMIAFLLFVCCGCNKNEHTHEYGSWIVVTEANCTQEGLKKHVCSCGHEESVVIEKTGHSVVVDAKVDATCSSTGLTEGSHCSVCNTVIVAQEVIAKLEHTIVVDPGKAPTETETGLTEGSHCSVCNTVIVAQEVIAKIFNPLIFFDNYINANVNDTLDQLTGVVCYVGTKSSQKVAGIYIGEGITIYVFSKSISETDWKKTFIVGDNVTIAKGTKDIYNNGLHEYVLGSLSDVTVNSSNNVLPEYQDITTLITNNTDLTKVQSSLIKVTGTIKKVDKNYYIVVGSTELQIYADTKFGTIDLTKLEVGSECEIRGVLSWYKSYQILPINNDYVTIVDSTNQGNNTNQGNTNTESTIKAEKKTFNESLSQENNGPLTYGCLPSVGKPNVLVIPINLDNSNKTDKVLNDIKLAFTGTEEQTGWESVNSYYKESSYGKLDINFNVIGEWFTPSKTATYYNNYYDKDGNDGSILLLREALAYYDNQIDYSQYDLDNDGSIDSVWLIYNSSVNFTSSDSLYWAFTSWCYDETQYDGKYAYYYAFAGY